MHPNRRPELHHLTSYSHDFPQSPTTDPYLFGSLSAQHMVADGHPGDFSVQDSWHLLPAEQGPLAHDTSNPSGISPGTAYHVQPAYTETTTQAVQWGHTGEGEMVTTQEQVQALQRPVPRLVFQVPFRCARHPAPPDTIEFVVDGERGVRLSDALEDNWVGFEGRDDRSLFEGDRLQIIIRLQLIGCLPWQSKIHIADFTTKRRSISRTKLAAEVAKSVRKFIAREKQNGHDANHPQCGWGDVSLENVFLTRITRVSVASWQPEIFLERQPPLTQAPASSSLNPLGRNP